MNDFLSSSHPAIVARTLQACKKGEGRGCRKVEVVEMENRVLKVCIAALQLQASQNQFAAVETRGIPTPDINIGSDISPGRAETNLLGWTRSALST